jgi:hypothetical protein
VLAGAPVAGWPRRMFLFGRTGRVARSDGPFLVQSSCVRRALRRSQPSRVPSRDPEGPRDWAFGRGMMPGG